MSSQQNTSSDWLQQSLRRVAKAKLASLKSNECTDATAELIARWHDDPGLYAWERLGTRLHDKQVEIALDVARYAHVCVHSGQKTGKSRGAVCTGTWWCETRERAPVILTSTTEDQVKDILWDELREVLRAVAEKPSATEPWVLEALRLLPLPSLPLDPRRGIQSPLTHNWLRGRVAGTQEGTAGFSGANILIIADEASGIKETFFAAFEGNTAGGGHQLLYGNPTQTSGTFFEAERQQIRGEPPNETGVWKFHRLRSVDAPLWIVGREWIPGLATPEWCEQRRKQWGVDDPRYQVRVLGRPPSQAANSVVALLLVEQAVERWPSCAPDGPISLGLDVARFGDDQSVAQPNRGSRALEARACSGFDSIQVAGMALDVIVANKRVDEPACITVDVGGGYGGGVVDQLRVMLKEHTRPDIQLVRVHEFNGSAAARDPQYVNARDEALFGVGEWLKEGGSIPPDDELQGDILAPQYSFDTKGRRKVEPKDQIKKRLGRSPDKGDALAIAIYGAGNQMTAVVPRQPRPASRWGDDTNARGF